MIPKINYKLTDAEFVAGENELCFSKVLDTFEGANYIKILTYNISASSDVLLNRIREVGEKGVPITIITNIPNRWSFYYNDNNVNSARKSIALYERKLDPKQIGPFAQIFFKFNNHGKIIMTDTAVYWGSANYSDESKKNYECGTISTDKKFIQFLEKEVFSALIDNSTSYFSHEYNECIMTLYTSLSLIHNFHQEIKDASFAEWADYDTNFKSVEYFDTMDNYLSEKLFYNYFEALEGTEDVLQTLEYNLIENDMEYEENDLFELISQYENCVSQYLTSIHDFYEDIEPLCQFDEQEYVDNLLSEEFYSEAYDENLDYYAQKAFEMGREKKQEFISDAKDSIKSILELLVGFENEMIKFIDKVMLLAKTNESIDNT